MFQQTKKVRTKLWLPNQTWKVLHPIQKLRPSKSLSTPIEKGTLQTEKGAIYLGAPLREEEIKNNNFKTKLGIISQNID